MSLPGEGRLSIGHALERGHAIGEAASQLATAGFDNRVHVRANSMRSLRCNSHRRASVRFALDQSQEAAEPPLTRDMRPASTHR